MKYPKRSQYKYSKSRYRVRNWPQYESALRRRGDLTIWFSEDAIQAWHAPTSGKPGGQRVYANIAIEAAVTIRMVFHLPLRQTEGFLRSLAIQLQLDLPVPDHNLKHRLCHIRRHLRSVVHRGLLLHLAFEAVWDPCDGRATSDREVAPH